MHKTLLLSAYTPSNTDPEILEHIFVQRHRMLEQIVAWCEESITTKKKNHLLFVGSRGSGKTHLISMVINRLKNKVKLQDKMIIIWLGEDDVITNLVDLMLAIIEKMVQTNPQRFNKECLQHAKGQSADNAAEIIMHSINEQIAKDTMLLVKENMSDVFRGLKDGGQKKLRAYLQENNNIAILASSQQLFSGISSRDAAFFGFFDTYHLKALEVKDAKQLISNIATLNNNQKLVDYLKTPQGGYRVRALHYLAGGNHRLYVELAAFLTMESLDDFVAALTGLADNLTPYFQERIRSLPDQQGKIVQKLCELQGATPVKTIAEESFIGERSVAKQLGDLAKKGYVNSHRRGKQSYYEIAEPLMRLALEVKNNHGKPLKMVAALLRAWFSDSELKAGQVIENKLSSEYNIAALAMDKEILATINNRIEEQFIAAIDANDYEKAISVSRELIDAPQTGGVPLIQRANALAAHGIANYQLGKIKQAVQDWTSVIEMQKIPTEHKARALFSRSITYGQTGKTEQQLQDLIALIEMQDVPKDVLNMALFERPRVYYNLLKVDEAQKALQLALDEEDKNRGKYPTFTNEILHSIIQLGSSSWKQQISWIIPLYAEHEVLNYLAAALMHSIAIFIEDESLASSFKKWQLLWQQHAEKYQEMQIPLQVLEAALRALEQKNDKPLLSLPKEIRELVLPMFSKIWSGI